MANIDRSFICSKDSIRISCIGYQSLSLKPGVDHKYPDTVRLSASVTALREVIVGPSAPDVVAGIVKKKYRTHSVVNPDESYLQFIPNEKKIKGTITAIEYVLNDELHGIEKPFRVRLFTKSKGSLKPDQELIRDSIVVNNPQKKRIVSVDISGYDIQFPDDGVIAVFETLSLSAYGNDSTWYCKEPYGCGWRSKVPCIEMDSRIKDDYPGDLDKVDRTGPYFLVGPPASPSNLAEMWNQWWASTPGHNFAISITIRQEN